MPIQNLDLIDPQASLNALNTQIAIVMIGAIDLNTREFTFGAGVLLRASVNIPSKSDKLHWNVCKAW